MDELEGGNSSTGIQQSTDDPTEFGKYPKDWYKQSFSALSPRRVSNPIAIPKPLYLRRPSVVTPIAPVSPVICDKCGLHSRPSTAEIIETGGCSPQETRRSSYFSDGSFSGHGRRPSIQQHWALDECCEGFCPDTKMPPRQRLASVDSGYSTSSVGGQRPRHHRRRKSSLCYGQSVVNENEETEWSCGRDIRTNDKDEADKIARNIVAQGRRGSRMSTSSTYSGSAFSDASDCHH